MKKRQIINKFTKSLIVEKKRKNGVTTAQITSTLVTAAIDLAFVNESCKSSGQLSKSQVIYRKLDDCSKDGIQANYRENMIKLFPLLKIFSRNRKFIISFDTTKEAFYGDFAKADDPTYLHAGSIAKESYHYYEFLTVAITCNDAIRYIVDGMIVPIGCFIEDYIFEMVKFVKANIPIEVFLFDRGFASWAIIHKLQNLKVRYLIFWPRQGEWYKYYFNELQNGEMKKILKVGKYCRDKNGYKISSAFVLIKQLKYADMVFDWIFATNLDLKSAESYVKRYKKRWGIETIYRVTDKIRIYTTSTKLLVRYFLFMFTCFVYNIWKWVQGFLGEDFTLANFKTNMTLFMAKKGLIYPRHFDKFERLLTAKKLISC